MKSASGAQASLAACVAGLLGAAGNAHADAIGDAAAKLSKAAYPFMKERGVLNTLTEIDGIFKSTRRGKGKGRHKQRAGPRKLKNGNAAVKSKPGTSLAARAKDIAKGTSLADVD